MARLCFAQTESKFSGAQISSTPSWPSGNNSAQYRTTIGTMEEGHYNTLLIVEK